MSRLAVLFAGVLIISGCAVSPDQTVSTLEPVEPDKSNPFADNSPLPSADFPPKVLYQLLVAEMAGQRGQLEIAVASYLDAARESRDPKVAARAARIAKFAQALDESLEAALIWVEVEPENPEAQKMVAPLLLAFGRAPEALQYYERYIALSSGAADRGFMTIANQLARDRNSIAALSVMDKLVQQHRDFNYAWLAHAQLTMRQAKLEKALKKSSKHLDLLVLVYIGL